MILALPEVQSLRSLTSDGRLLFATRVVRMAAYGALSVVLALYLAEIGFNEARIGLLLSLTLFGDVAISALITTFTDRIGRRRIEDSLRPCALPELSLAPAAGGAITHLSKGVT